MLLLLKLYTWHLEVASPADVATLLGSKQTGIEASAVHPAPVSPQWHTPGKAGLPSVAEHVLPVVPSIQWALV